ncbi:MAG: acyl-CoA reductase [Persicimonas sp.]
MNPSDYPERLAAVQRFVNRLFARFDETVSAIVADGWPEAMAKAGLELHRQTWRADDVAEAFETEMRAVGGVEALEALDQADPIDGLGIIRPEKVVHIWPALPGAGLTPVLFGALLGVHQWIRPSRRAGSFARHVVDLWPTEDIPLELIDYDGDWTFGDVVVVSGRDETIEAIRRRLEEVAPSEDARVTGYGHRVSFAVVVDHEELDIPAVAERLATDTVMWHQSGCFSARGVVFCGTPERAAEFGAELGSAIAAEERRLDARSVDEAHLAERAQARGVAEFNGRVWGDGLGWVQQTDQAFDGRWIAPHALTLHRIDRLEELVGVVALPPNHIQGVALAAPSDTRCQAVQILGRLGATRICSPGQLQAPPANWRHDGRPNILEWVRVVTICDE